MEGWQMRSIAKIMNCLKTVFTLLYPLHLLVFPPTFPVRGLQAFRIAYIHTQNNTTFYVGIKHEPTKIQLIRRPPKFSLWRKPNNNNNP
jgi:hypothetical protein